MATSVKMYRLPKLASTPTVVDLPTCMYKMSPINKFASTDLASSYYGSTTCATNYVSGPPGKIGGLAELEMRQEAVLHRLQCLKQQLDKLQNNKCLTDQSMPSMSVVGAAAQSSPVKQPAGVKQAVVEHILMAIKDHLDDISSLHFSSQIQIGTVHDLVIAANPDRPPYSLVLLRKLLKNVGFPVYCANHVHSSVKKVSESLQKTFTESPEGDRSKHSLAFTLHWKDVSSPSLMVNPLHQTPISGEANIIRYVSRLFPLSSPYNYEATGTFTSITETDNLLDQLTNQMICGNNKERQAVLRLLNGRLGRASWLMGDKCSIVDVMAWSAVRQTGSEAGAPANVSKWYRAVSNLAGLESSLPQENNIVSSKNEKNQTISKNAGKTSNGHMDRKGLEQLLKKLNMKFQVQDHEEVFTVEALMKNVSPMSGLHMKNLFLKDKKKNLYLLSARHNAEVKLNEVGKQIGVKELRFGDESVMFDVLGVKQGCVTAYALINDKNHQVKFLLDSEALDERHEYINFHPMSNAATLGISPANLKTFLSHTGHEPTLLTFK
ncbi:aminoacyl tRNA synthase complex-interacting multifunctional protein 2 isoform X4 [Macrobrachium rosenbergii]|uniref:aminoacyl tRNA synthase complex-interacting multifunctional protein 2 isoform X4 n=1 Tax=Macrobrachium rosenbergii TaxID=79674 RepID=UPI0034D55A2C